LLRRAFAASFATIGSMITADSLNTAMVQHDTLDRPSGIVKRGVMIVSHFRDYDTMSLTSGVAPVPEATEANGASEKAGEVKVSGIGL
jgi:hypothetical protein